MTDRLGAQIYSRTDVDTKDAQQFLESAWRIHTCADILCDLLHAHPDDEMCVTLTLLHSERIISASIIDKRKL